MRLAHREWLSFETTGPDRWDRALLTSVLTSAGVLGAPEKARLPQRV